MVRVYVTPATPVTHHQGHLSRQNQDLASISSKGNRGYVTPTFDSLEYFVMAMASTMLSLTLSVLTTQDDTSQ